MSIEPFISKSHAPANPDQQLLLVKYYTELGNYVDAMGTQLNYHQKSGIRRERERVLDHIIKLREIK